jgi:uncharacterized protein YqgC (DUF456 family)
MLVRRHGLVKAAAKQRSTDPGLESCQNPGVTAALWVLALLLIATGVVGTLLPALPGPILVFTGFLIGAWAEGFERVGIPTLVLLALMTGATYLVDLVATVFGVRRAGASGRAVIGAALGLLAGLMFGLFGVLIGPFVGAVLGELTVRNDLRHASRMGFAAWLGFLVGTIAKLALVFAMLGIFVAALILF